MCITNRKHVLFMFTAIALTPHTHTHLLAIYEYVKIMSYGCNEQKWILFMFKNMLSVNQYIMYKTQFVFIYYHTLSAWHSKYYNKYIFLSCLLCLLKNKLTFLNEWRDRVTFKLIYCTLNWYVLCELLYWINQITI